MKLFFSAVSQSNHSDASATNVTDIHKSPLLPRLSAFSIEERRHRLATYRKFIFVRHPLERLVSAYLNKFGPLGRLTFYQEIIGRQILRLFRPGFHDAATAGDDVTFREFIQFVIHEYSTSLRWMDVHWKPAADLCQPCLIDYDFVGKYATLMDDAEWLLDELDLPARIRFPVARSQAKKHTRDQFANLNSSLVERLIQVYEKDFRLFGYDPKHFE